VPVGMSCPVRPRNNAGAGSPALRRAPLPRNCLRRPSVGHRTHPHRCWLALRAAFTSILVRGFGRHCDHFVGYVDSLEAPVHGADENGRI
jgi:hypothetical protein